MKGKAFLDTNLLIYFVADDLPKKQRVHELLIRNPAIAISTQVINEFVAVSLKKDINSRDDTFRYAAEFMELFELFPVDVVTILRSFELMRTGNYSPWDSLIIASALQSQAKTLFTDRYAARAGDRRSIDHHRSVQVRSLPPLAQPSVSTPFLATAKIAIFIKPLAQS